MSSSPHKQLVYGKAYSILKDAAPHATGISLEDYQDRLATTPGVRFPPGVSFTDVVDNMKSWGLVQVKGRRIAPMGW